MSTGPLTRLRAMAFGTGSFQAGAYVLFGLLQLALDTAVFVLLTSMGMAVLSANVLGRLCGAVLGFTLNGRFTFADGGRSLTGRAAFARFTLLWLTLTLVGTGVLMLVEQRLGLVQAWFSKPVLEALMAVAGFFGLKYFVFRARQRPMT